MTKLLKTLWHRFTRFSCAHRDNPLFRLMDRMAVRFHADYENSNFDMATNGERATLERLACISSFKHILDVGANVGDWSMLASELHPDARIFSFEIAEPTYRTLSERVRGKDKITVLDYGLSDRIGPISIQYIPEHTGASTGLDIEFEYDTNKLQPRRLEARVTTGDVFLKESGIEQVDYLKIDVEGMEYQVLRGFAEALSAQRIKVIQFEYGLWNIVSKFMLRDFHQFFKGYGYIVGKLYPRYVDFSPYMFNRENLIGSNYMAIPEQQTSLRASLETRR